MLKIEGRVTKKGKGEVKVETVGIPDVEESNKQVKILSDLVLALDRAGYGMDTPDWFTGRLIITLEAADDKTRQ